MGLPFLTASWGEKEEKGRRESERSKSRWTGRASWNQARPLGAVSLRSVADPAPLPPSGQPRGGKQFWEAVLETESR